MVTHQLQVERRTGKVRRSETDVLPLCHATTNRKYHIAYLFMPFPMTLGDLEGHSLNAELQFEHFFATLSTVLTDTARRAVPR